MAPVDASTKAAMNHLANAVSELPLKLIDWIEGRVLIIDNWRMLHGRSEPERSGDDRELIRVLAQ